jgi:3-oxoadipate enol-lactonase
MPTQSHATAVLQRPGARLVYEVAGTGPAVVLDGVPWDRESEAGMDEVAWQVRAGGVPAGRAAWLAHPLFAAARQRPDLASSLAGMLAGYPGQHWLGLDPHQQVRPDPFDALEQVAAPTLVAVGEHDVPGFREMSAVLARRIPCATHRVVAGAGHMANMEQPAAVSELLTRFLDGLPPSADGRPAGQEN